MKYAIIIWNFCIKRWDRIRQAAGLISQAAGLVFGLGEELSQELEQVEEAPALPTEIKS